MKNIRIWINGRLVGMKDARISVFDRGFLYGDGVFETMRSYAGAIFRLDDHLARLFKSFAIIKIKPPHSRSYFKDALHNVLKANCLKSAYIRLAVTRGEGRFGIGYRDRLVPNVVIVAKEFEGYPEWMHDRGISAGIVELRQNEYSPLSRIKSMNYLNYILARLCAKEGGCDEAILMNTEGRVSEAATSNIFLVKRRTIVTPSLDSGILPGVTRGVVIGIAKRLKLTVAEQRVSPSDLMNADEIFLTNSLAEILPVVRVDSRKIGDGSPGELTKLLRISYQKEVIREVLF